MYQKPLEKTQVLDVGKLPSEIRISTTLALTIILGGLFNTGMMYQQFQQIKDEQKGSAALVSMIRENQINELASIGNIKIEQSQQAGRIDRVDKRLIVVEGHLMFRDRK